LLQSAHWEGLRDGPGRLCFDNLHLAEDFAFPCFGRWPNPRLDPAKARDNEDAGFLFFFPLFTSVVATPTKVLMEMIQRELPTGSLGFLSGARGNREDHDSKPHCIV